mgnify:CR=1 FL=1
MKNENVKLCLVIKVIYYTITAIKMSRNSSANISSSGSPYGLSREFSEGCEPYSDDHWPA